MNRPAGTIVKLLRNLGDNPNDIIIVFRSTGPIGPSSLSPHLLSRVVNRSRPPAILWPLVVRWLSSQKGKSLDFIGFVLSTYY